MEEKQAHRYCAHCQGFSRIGWALFVQMISSMVVQAVALVPVVMYAPALMGNPYFLWGINVFSSYVVAFPLFCLILRKDPAQIPIQRRPLVPIQFFQTYLIGVAALYLFNLLSLGITTLIGLLRGTPVGNPVDAIMDFPLALNLILACVLAPVAEEIMFRKLLLNRLRPYGECFAVFASAVAFGLMHGNISQMLYAFAVGVVFGCVAIKTGCVWQTILLHSMVNFISTGLIPLLDLFGPLGGRILNVTVIAAILLGISFFLALRRDVRLDRGELSLVEPLKWRLFFENPGMIVFCLLVVLSSVTTIMEI